MLKHHPQKIRSLILATAMALTVFSGTVTSAETPAIGNTDYEIVNPYEAVDWEHYGQYKANFHMHSYESDGSAEPAAMIEEHYRQGYDIVALTDHNFTSTTMDRTDRPSRTYLTSERLAEINAGVGRDGRGMIAIPYSNEQSRSDHVNTFWTDFNNQSGATLESNIAAASTLGGISHINHPGRYTGGVTTANNGETGAFLSSDPFTVKKYVDLFNAYPSSVGMEIINKKDGDSFSDRILWDNILKQMMPERPVWGFSNDDNHSISATGFSYNIMLMPSNTLENVRYSMENGTFYAVARVAKRELGFDFVAEGPSPVISSIGVDQQENSISIFGEHFSRVEWIADGQIFATGNEIDLNDYEAQIGQYVRAQLIGAGGISFTQPFGILGGEEKEPELAMAKLTASRSMINSDMSTGIALSLQGINDVAEYVNLDDASVVYSTSPSGILAVSTDGIVTIETDPTENQSVAIWADVTLNGKTVKSNILSVMVTLPGQIVAPVMDGLDDVEEKVSGGTMYMDSSDLEIIRDGSSNQIIGTRFQNVFIPEGSCIVSAYIQFTTDEVSSSKNVDPFNVTIQAEAVPHSPAFTTDMYNVSSRTMTESSVLWTGIPKWTKLKEAGENQRTSDLAQLVQEVVDMNGWSEGNAITFTFRGEGVRCAEAFEGGGLKESPRLYVVYLTLEDQIEELTSEVEALAIGRGPKNSLLVKLDNALSKLESNPTVTANVLNALANEIKALQQSGRLSADTAVDLAEMIHGIIGRLK